MIFEFRGKLYPEFIKFGNACQYVSPIALQFCKGKGLDVGAGKWPLHKAIPIDIADGGDAMNLPEGPFDYIFSSHMLEHLPDYVSALEHWKTRLKPLACLFLYLPHPSMEHWRPGPQNNRKHLHLFWPADIEKLLNDLGFENVIVSGCDMAFSFSAVGFVPES